MSNDRPPSAPTSFVRRHVLWLTVLTLTLSTAAVEISRRSRPVDLYLDSPLNFADVVSDLYPDQAGSYHVRAAQLSLCMTDAQRFHPVPLPCEKYRQGDPVFQLIEFNRKGIAAGRQIEDLYYNQIRLLVMAGASRQKIDEAYSDWRRNFPLSRRPDPRVVRAQVSQGDP